jgi:hypothetical protein
VSTIIAIATEPRFSESLSWLDPSRADDRIVASSLEVFRQHVRSRVVVVTRDLNLQNKLEIARIPCITPGELVAEG